MKIDLSRTRSGELRREWGVELKSVDVAAVIGAVDRLRVCELSGLSELGDVARQKC